MAIEPMFMRRNYGQEVYSFPHSAPVFLEGNILCCFTLSSLYQAWTVFHPLLCKYRITSNRENWEKLHPDVSVQARQITQAHRGNRTHCLRYGIVKKFPLCAFCHQNLCLRDKSSQRLAYNIQPCTTLSSICLSDKLQPVRIESHGTEWTSQF